LIEWSAPLELRVECCQLGRWGRRVGARPGGVSEGSGNDLSQVEHPEEVAQTNSFPGSTGKRIAGTGPARRPPNWHSRTP
jgi:hypothetical protein